MKRLTRLMIAAALTIAAMFSVSKEVAAIDWCWSCQVNPENNYSCCRCWGGTDYYCTHYLDW